MVPEADLASVTAELPRHIELTRKEAGCLLFQVTPDAEDHRIYHVYEEFADSEAFEAHQARVRHSRWGEVTANVERHYEVRRRAD